MFLFCLSSASLLWSTVAPVLLVFQRQELTRCEVVSVGKMHSSSTEKNYVWYFMTHSGDVFVATVTGATCNCVPTEGEQSVIYCHDYQLASGSNEITVELLGRG